MTRIATLIATTSMLAFAACQTGEVVDVEDAVAPPPPVADLVEPAEEAAPEPAEVVEATIVPMTFDGAALKAVLDAQPDEVKARYIHRHPAETLEFFGITPGMTVVESLPGGGWYTKILLPYLGPEGTVIGAHYPDEVWGLFGFFDEEAIAKNVADRKAWPETAAGWGVEDGAAIASTVLTDMPEPATGTVDAALFIRSLHNLHRFNPDTGFFDTTLAETFRVLKPGGVVGVVQHRAPADNPDAWADGSAGYLKQAALISAFEDAGFILEASSELNANAKDQPTAEDFVWRLPPSFNGTEEGTPERAAFAAVGESDRMTLRFRKPG